TPRDLPASRRRFLLRLALSAAQSALFNRALAARIEDGLIECVLAGDVMQVVASGGLFLADDVPREQERFDRGETITTGPIFGVKMRRPAGEPLEREERLLNDCGMDHHCFGRFKRLMPGTRRAYVVRPEGLEIRPEADGLRFRFSLPSGSYATLLLREFLNE
ncbi:MAG: tRNA pseudouridine(13) synthase TruD, partial [Planctomycetaceae bacterium]